MASDGKWYPPETHASAAKPLQPPTPVAVETTTEPGLPARVLAQVPGLAALGQIAAALVAPVAVTAPFTSTDETKPASSNGGQSEEASVETTTRKATTTTTQRPSTTTEAPTTTTTEAPSRSPSQAQAVGAVEDYLAFTHFSRRA
jgi:hypothetical protein